MLIFLIVISSVLINSALGNGDPKKAVDKSTNEAPTDDENNDQQQDNAIGSGKLMKGMVWLLAASSGLKGANAVGDNGAQIVQVNPTIPPANAPLPPKHAVNLSDLKPHTQLVPNVPRKIGKNANNNGKKNGNQ